MTSDLARTPVPTEAPVSVREVSLDQPPDFRLAGAVWGFHGFLGGELVTDSGSALGRERQDARVVGETLAACIRPALRAAAATARDATGFDKAEECLDALLALLDESPWKSLSREQWDEQWGEGDFDKRLLFAKHARRECADEIAAWLQHIDRLDEIPGAKESWPAFNPLWDAAIAIAERFGTASETGAEA